MNLPQFLLDDWLAQKHNAATPVEYDLGSSTGPVWTLRELLSLGGDLEELLEAPISYVNSRGSFALRDAIALLEGCDPEHVQATTGGAEALLLIFSDVAAAGANVVLPRPGFPTNDAMAQAFGLEARHYVLRQENGFRIDADEIRGLIDANTRLVLVNSPHNPTGATLSDLEMEGLHDFCAERGVQFLSDQVYHPIYHEGAMRTAARLPHATVLGRFLEGALSERIAYRMDCRTGRGTPPPLPQCPQLFHGLRQLPWRNAWARWRCGNARPSTRAPARSRPRILRGSPLSSRNAAACFTIRRRAEG